MAGIRPADRASRLARGVWWRATALLCVLFLAWVESAEAPAYGLGSLAPAPGGFACVTPTVFNASGSPTRLFAETPGSAGSRFTPVGMASGVQYNAIGFRAADRLIYAVSGPNGTVASGHLVVVDNTGAVFDRGPIIGIPAADLTRGVNAGAFDDVGRFWVAAAGSPGSGRLYRVDLVTRVAIPLAGQTAPVQALDLTFANQFLWGAGPAQTIVRVDPRTGAVTTFGVPSLRAGPFPAAWTFADGRLGFGSLSGVVYEFAVGRPGTAAPTFTLVGTGPGLASGANDGTSCSPRPVDLAIDLTGPTRRAPGSPVTWTLTVHNRSAGASSGFIVSDVVPSGYAGLSSPTPGCAVTGNALRCHGGALAAGAHAVISLTASAPRREGCLGNTASVLGAEPDPIQVNNTSSLSTCVRAASGLRLVQTASLPAGRRRDGLARVGDVVTFSFQVTNADEEPVYAVSVADRLAGPGSFLVPVTCPRRSLSPGQSMTCTSSHTVTQADVDAGRLIAEAVAAGRSPEGPAVVSNSSTVTIPAFVEVGLSLHRHVILLVDVNRDGRVDPGDQVSWLIDATNTGTLTLHGVRVNDGLLTAAGIVVGCPRSTLAPGESMTCASAPRTVTSADVASGLLGGALLGSASPGQTSAGSFPGGGPDGQSSGGGEIFGPEVGLAFTGVGGIWPLLALGLGLILLGTALVIVWRRTSRGVNRAG